MSEDRKTEFEYVLQQPIDYDIKGERETAQMILLKAPTSRNSRECAALKQAFWRSADREGTSTEDKEVDVDIKGQDVIVMLAMSTKTDLADVMDIAHRLFTKGKVAFVDGEVPLTKPLLENMSQEDVEAMLGEYLVNFTLASSLAQMKAKSSKGSSH